MLNFSLRHFSGIVRNITARDEQAARVKAESAAFACSLPVELCVFREFAWVQGGAWQWETIFPSAK